MEGALLVEAGTIYDLLDLCFNNLGWRHGHWVQRALDLVRRLMRRLTQHNLVSVARANLAHHYELFLDVDRQYSCAYYVSPDDTLERAQEQKKRHIVAKLLLCPGQKVLDIGSGWGGLALHLARAANVDVEFALSLHPDKTRLIEFGRFAAARRARRGLGKPSPRPRPLPA
jgi:cyclopropane-fatty-acyl-phospholipid synthase